MAAIDVEDIAPGPRSKFRGASPGDMVAALERAMLENMLSLVYTAQSRMMRNGPSTATNWSGAEDGAMRMARTAGMLARSITSLVKAYGSCADFKIDRDYADARRNQRIDTLAAQALISTDPDRRFDVLEERADAVAYREALNEMIDQNRSAERDYMRQTTERLQRYEPEWATLEQFRTARRAGEEAARQPTEPPEADPPDPDRVKIEAEFRSYDAHQRRMAAYDKEIAEETRAREAVREKSAKQVVDLERLMTTISGGASGKTAPADPPAPPVRRGRGAGKGNDRALKNGRFTAEAFAERDEDRDAATTARALCQQADELTAMLADRTSEKETGPPG
jgi:hypothetical protein